MFTSLLRPKKRRPDRSPFSSAYARGDSPMANRNHASGTPLSTAVTSEASSEDEQGNEHTSLLPIFSAAHLDSIPVYNLVHTIRADIVSRVDTILTWEQLRSPQVSSFLVKPILGTLIRGPGKISRGILYSLMANCLQFRKEANENPGNAGVSRTRALLSELLAIKLLKEFSTRELIDALSYDFYPLQGLPPPTTPPSIGVHGQKSAPRTPPSLLRASRISALEIAIRAQAKTFLSHPVVIQQIEAIWSGNIVFHCASDQIHRMRDSPKDSAINVAVRTYTPSRRAATLYDARDASLFKLSRLRVPRYRYILSTLSLAILLILYLMVLVGRSSTITSLEIVFWLWSFGFMMDEVTGFTETGITLYFMSLWNAFDMAIFLFFMVFYVMRIYSLVYDDRKIIIDWSYDVLAACAVFLFPRIFSVLDHYRYFSQLIIAFKIMAVDMVALLVVIAVSCSGFFVAFTLSFARDYYSAQDVLYSLFQMVMGFTPAAWDSWSKYNVLGKVLLAAFLIICHFLVVTILITVLTNSFAAVAANAQEEHQFLVAVNTLSLVKNDALFSYVAPTNLIAWLLHPLRYCMPFPKFVKLNRTIIKFTHLPILFIIYAYESTILCGAIFEPTDGISKHELRNSTLHAVKATDMNMFGSVRKLRGMSVGSHQQEQILDEVFRKPYRGLSTVRQDNNDIQKSGGVVDSWMKGVPPPGAKHTRKRPLKKERETLLKFEKRENYGTIERVKRGIPRRDFSMSRSVHSDPEDFISTTGAYGRPSDAEGESGLNDLRTEDDGDDEAISGDEEEAEIEDDTRDIVSGANAEADEMSSKGSRFPQLDPSASGKARAKSPPELLSRKQLLGNHHTRTDLTGIIKRNQAIVQSSEDDSDRKVPRNSLKGSDRTGQHTPGGNSSGRKSPRSRPQTATRPRPIMPPHIQFQSVPSLGGSRLLADHARSGKLSRSSSVMMDFSHQDENVDLISSSFATQMAMATGASGVAGDVMLGRLLLARIGTLEEGMKDVKDILKEVKKLRKDKEGKEEENRGRKARSDDLIKQNFP